jgi:hypothetical protein
VFVFAFVSVLVVVLSCLCPVIELSSFVCDDLVLRLPYLVSVFQRVRF